MNDIIKLFFRFTILKMELNLEYFFYIYTKKTILLEFIYHEHDDHYYFCKKKSFSDQFTICIKY